MAGKEARWNRAAVMAALGRAVRGSQVDRVRLAVMCAGVGAHQANTGHSLASCLAEIDEIEAMLFEKLEASSGEPANSCVDKVLGGVRQIHGCCARMRVAAAAGFSHAAASAARKRVRTARHDIVN